MEHGRERRRWQRVGREMLAGVSAVIPAGPSAELLNISRGGALLQVAGRLAPEVGVRLRLAKPGCLSITIDGRVAWVRVANLTDGQVLYHAGIRFDALIPNAESLFTPAADAQSDTLAEPDGSSPLAAPEGRSIDVVETIECERQQWESERAATIAQLEQATRRADTLQARLDAQTHEHAEALVTVRTQFEGVIADLVSISQARQEECGRLTERLTGVEEMQRQDAAKFEAIIADLVKTAQDKTAECERLEKRLAVAEETQQRDTAQFERMIGDLVKSSEEKQIECEQLALALGTMQETHRADTAEFERIIDNLVRTLQQKETDTETLSQQLAAADAAHHSENAELVEQVAYWTREAQEWERQAGDHCRMLQDQLAHAAERRAAFDDTRARQSQASPVVVRLAAVRANGGDDQHKLAPVLAAS